MLSLPHLAFSRGKRIDSVHHFLQILMLGRNCQREAGNRQQSDEDEHRLFHLNPLGDQLAVLDAD